MLTSTKERWYFEVGDWVYLMVLPYRLKSLAKKCNEKLSPWFFGPYQVLDKFGPVAYHLAFPPSSCIHLVFHVSVLKKALPPDVQAHEIPEELTEEWEIRAEPEDLLGCAIIERGRQRCWSIGSTFLLVMTPGSLWLSC